MTSQDFLQFHPIPTLQRRHAKRAVTPMLFPWLQRPHSCPRTPESDFQCKYWFQTKILSISMEFTEICVQNQILMVLRGPWLARAGNLHIPIGISRFLSLPGPLRSFQNREIPKVSIEIIFSTAKLVLPPLDLKKWPQNVTFM